MRKLLRYAALSLGAIVAAVLSAFAALVVWPPPEMPRPGIAGDVVIRNVRVVDVQASTARQPADVVVRDGVIAVIGTDAVAPPHAREIDGTGMYLMPGLWDMHTHSNTFADQYQHPLFIANGVTGVREMWGCMSRSDPFIACIEDRTRWNRELASGASLSPRYIGQSSFQINGGDEVPAGYESFFRLRNASDADALARFYEHAGADFLKVYSAVSPEAYAALADAAAAHDLALAGHRPLKVPLRQAIDAGQRSIEHGRLFALECYEAADDFRALPDPLAAYDTGFIADLVDGQDTARCDEMMAAMAGSETWWTPTLQTLRMGAMAHDPVFRNDPRSQYVPGVLRRLMWTPDADRNAATALDASGRNVRAALYSLALGHVRKAHATGVRLLAGTDSFDTYVYPGFSLHDELGRLVEAGLSPAAALRTATIDAATYMGLDDSYGSVEIGKSADLLLVSADPLQDISNTLRIEALVFSGHYYDRDALDALLAFAARRAGSMHQNVQIIWRAVRSPLVRAQFAD
ncbi:MAG: amidohydrolase family protein [Gammaproteobacteria bacterium]